MSYLCVNMTKIFFLLWFHCLAECWWLENQKCMCRFDWTLNNQQVAKIYQPMKTLDICKVWFPQQHPLSSYSIYFNHDSDLLMLSSTFSGRWWDSCKKEFGTITSHVGNIVVMVSNNKINIILDLICKAFRCKL